MMFESRIFKDPKWLDEGQIPPTLRVRRREAEMLIRRYLNRFYSGAAASDITLIYGSIGRVGIGKTTLGRFVGKAVEDSVGRYGVKAKYIYINVFAAPSIHQILALLAMQVGLRINVRGITAIEALRAIVDHLERRNMYALVVLDEFQSLLLSSKSSWDDLYLLLRVHEEVPTRDGLNRIFFLLIASDIRILSLMKDRIPQVESQIGFKIHLKPYTPEELYEILEQRAELALKPTAWQPYLLEMIADSFGYRESESRGDGNARKAITSLRMAAERAEAEDSYMITENHIRWAISENMAGYIPVTELRALSFHELLLLLALSKEVLYRGGYVTTGELTKRYQEIAEHYNERPRGHSQLNVYIRNLSNLGFIEARGSGKGIRGRTTLLRISPEIPVDRLVEVLEHLLVDRLN
ncbi:MAG: AAA family ATPase [Desulfurococcales archaeon]|nr:AAA family ATPase [Desulfurococcales archaeon]